MRRMVFPGKNYFAARVINDQRSFSDQLFCAVDFTREHFPGHPAVFRGGQSLFFQGLKIFFSARSGKVFFSQHLDDVISISFVNVELPVIGKDSSVFAPKVFHPVRRGGRGRREKKESQKRQADKRNDLSVPSTLRVFVSADEMVLDFDWGCAFHYALCIAEKRMRDQQVFCRLCLPAIFRTWTGLPEKGPVPAKEWSTPRESAVMINMNPGADMPIPR